MGTGVSIIHFKAKNAIMFQEFSNSFKSRRLEIWMRKIYFHFMFYVDGGRLSKTAISPYDKQVTVYRYIAYARFDTIVILLFIYAPQTEKELDRFGEEKVLSMQSVENFLIYEAWPIIKQVYWCIFFSNRGRDICTCHKLCH